MTSRARGRPIQGDSIADEVLLDAALQSFGEYGYDGASVRKIARDLKVSHNLIPQRFGSKEKLWYAAVDHGYGRLLQQLMREAQALGRDELLVLRGLIRSFIELNASQPALLQVINQEASQPGPRLDYLFETYIKPIRDFGESWLSRLAQEGKIAPVSVTLMYFLMTHGAGGVFSLPALTQRLSSDADTLATASIEERAQRVVDLFFNGLLPRPMPR